jgi:hypothetical protein
MRHKPTSEEARIIRDCAQRSAGHKRVSISPGSRYNTEGKFEGNHLNIAMVTNEQDWDDTDLWSNAWKWSDFTKGVELTEDGRGIFDFYVYSLGHHGELETNVTAYYENKRLVRVDGTCDGTMWKAS